MIKLSINYCKTFAWVLICSLYLSVFVEDSHAQQKVNESNVLDNWMRFKNASGFLYHHLADQAYVQLDKRTSEVTKINTLEDWRKRQAFIRETLLDIVGPLPEKTPLNAQVVKVIKKEGFRVEHIIFESRPGFKVTSSLFIPEIQKGKAKFPAIIYCSGHSASGYRSGPYLNVILNLVKKGFVVLAFDPVGQGERLEYYNAETGEPGFGPTGQHSYPGAQAFITGSSQANYMIWDGIRAVDYLFTRKEVDISRIGITGRSGGGTQSAHIAAFDDRILAAAPENYLTNYTRLLQSRGPQDSEQNFYHGISRGIDHPDFLIVRAPKPYLMILTYNDMFNIQGARDTYKEAAKTYGAFGKSENLEVTEDFGGHTSTIKNNEAMYRFFQKHLDNPGNSHDEKVGRLIGEDLKVTQTGQIATSVGSETVFSLNRKQSAELYSKLQDSRAGLTNWFLQAVDQAKKLSGYIEPGRTPDPVLTGMLKKEGYVIEKYFIMGEGNYPVPYLLYIPEKLNNKVVLQLHPDGKSADSISIARIHSLVKEGFAVLSPDLIGTGETTSEFKGDAFIGKVSYNLWYASFLTGRSILGIRAGDVVSLSAILNKDPRFNEICAIAKGNMSPVLLHAAAFAPVFSRIALIEPLSSYRAIVMEKFYSPDYILNSVPGALRHYDLPDLAASLAPTKLLIVNPVNGAGKISDSEIISGDLAVIKNGYAAKKTPDNFVSLYDKTFENVINFFK